MYILTEQNCDCSCDEYSSTVHCAHLLGAYVGLVTQRPRSVDRRCYRSMSFTTTEWTTGNIFTF